MTSDIASAACPAHLIISQWDFFFCSSNLWRWRYLFYEYHVHTRDIFFVSRSTIGPFCRCFGSIPTFRRWQKSVNVAKWTSLFLLSENIFWLFTLFIYHARMFSSILRPSSTAAWSIRTNLCTKLLWITEIELFSFMWSSWFFGWKDQTDLCRFVRFHNTRILGFFVQSSPLATISSVAPYSAFLSPSCKASLVVVNGLFEFFVWQIDELDSSQFSSSVELCLLKSPVLLFLLFPHARRTNNPVWLLLGFSSGAPRSTQILQVSHLTMWASSILSTNLTKCDLHQHSKSLWYAYLDLIQNSVSCLGHVNILERQWEWFFFRHEELNSRCSMMTTSEVFLAWPEVVESFREILGFCWLIFIRASVKFFTEIFALRKFVLPQNGFSNFVNFPNKICRAVCDWQNYIVMIFVTLQFPLHRVFERGFLTRAISWFLNVRNQKKSPFQISLTTQAYLKNIVEICSPIWWNLDWSFEEIGTHLTNDLKRKMDHSEWFFKSLLIMMFPICQEDIDISQPLHRIRPPFLIQTILEQYCRCFLSCAHHSFSHTTRLGSIKWMLNDDAMKDVDKIFQIPVNVCVHGF